MPDVRNRIWMLAVLVALVLLYTITQPAVYTHVSSHLPAVRVDLHPHRTACARYNSSKVALLIETRPLARLTPLLLHMMAVVPPDWRFVFVGSAASRARVNASLPVQQHVQSCKLELRELDLSAVAGFEERGGVDALLTSAAFYERFVGGAEWLLVFHSDSVLCANSAVSVDDWLEYDWVSAPRRPTDRFGGSGGLSLRRMSRIHQVLRFQTWHDGSASHWLGDRLGLLPGARMANASEEMRFAVDKVWHATPMGFHGMDDEVWANHTQRQAIYAYCPEVKIVHDMRLERERCPDQDEERKEQERKMAELERKAKEEREKAAELEKEREREREREKGREKEKEEEGKEKTG